MGLLKKRELTSSAEVVDKHLILSLPNAIEPVVWRMALDKIGTAAFEIKKLKKEDQHKLVLKHKKGVSEVIAPFVTKDEAVEALMHASSALQRSEVVVQQKEVLKKDKSSQSIKEHLNARQKQSNKWLYLFLGFILVIGLYAYMQSQLPNKIDDFGGETIENITQQNNRSPKSGVPFSADDFLNGL